MSDQAFGTPRRVDFEVEAICNHCGRRWIVSQSTDEYEDGELTLQGDVYTFDETPSCTCNKENP